MKVCHANLPTHQLQRHIVMLVFPGCILQDAVGPLDVFNFANIAILRYDPTKNNPELFAYRLTVVAEKSGPVKSFSGVSIHADKSYEELDEPVDTLMIAGGAIMDDAMSDIKMRNWIISMMPKVRRLVSICSGAMILAACGILNNRRATTHWLFCEQMALSNQSITVEPDKIFIRDGNVYTSGGVTAGIDLSLSLVEEDWGWEAAAGAARGMLIFMRRPGGQSQFSMYVFNEAKNRKDFRELQAWIISNPNKNLSIEVLADRMAMSERNFSRVFCQEVGMTPAKFIERVRLEAARSMLTQSNQSVEQVAINCGFATAEQMRRTFQRLLNTTPQEFRANFK